MITPDEINQFAKHTGFSDSYLARLLNVTPKSLEMFKSTGITNPTDVQAFELARSNIEKRESFDFKEVLKFQERLGLRDVDMYLIFGLNKNSWANLKSGQEPSHQFRKLFKVAVLLEKTGYDIYRYIGFV